MRGKKHKRQIILLMALCIAIFALLTPHLLSPESPIEVEILDLQGEPSRYEGRVVLIRGYIISCDEDHTIRELRLMCPYDAYSTALVIATSLASPSPSVIVVSRGLLYGINSSEVKVLGTEINVVGRVRIVNYVNADGTLSRIPLIEVHDFPKNG